MKKRFKILYQGVDEIELEEITPEPESLALKIWNYDVKHVHTVANTTDKGYKVNVSMNDANHIAGIARQHYSGYIPKTEMMKVFNEWIITYEPSMDMSRLRKNLEAIKGVEEPK